MFSKAMKFINKICCLIGMHKPGAEAEHDYIVKQKCEICKKEYTQWGF